MTDQELKDLVASLAIAQRKTDEQLARTDAQQAKTDAQLAKTDEQLAKTDAQLAKTDERLNRLSDKVDRVASLVGDIGNNQGDVAEEFFYRSLIKHPQLNALQFETVYRNLPAHKKDLQDEFDIVLTNGDSVAIIEVKQKAHPNLIDEMLYKKLPNFRRLFPYYQNFKLYAGIASLVSYDTLIEKAKAAGLFCLTQQGDHVVLVNEDAKVF